MAVRLKKLEDQVIVLTGASSGIGLVTARMAAKRGVKLVLAARNEDALRQLSGEINDRGGEAVAVVADVGNEEAVRDIARAAVTRFGGFDTWVNNAGAAIYGAMLDVSTEDHRQLFETNFWGVVYGSLEAARHLRGRDGGAIINIGSEVSDRAVPIIGMYSASKHAVAGFTEALRMELEAAAAPISVTLVKPAAVHTPFPEHAKTYLTEEPALPAPLYAPEVVAETILHCAENPVRDVYAGGKAKLDAVQGALAPRLTDWIMETFFIDKQKSPRPANRADDALYRPTTGLRERGSYAAGRVFESSAYTKASLHPVLTAAVIVGTGLAAAALFGGVRNGRRG
jgi:short-subunit dehydrogenase